MLHIKLDKGAIAALSQAALRAAELTAAAMLGDVTSAQVMPFDVGTMQNTDTYTVTQRTGDSIESGIVTSAPQARRLYFHPEYNFQTVNNPNAGGAWLEPWLTGERAGFAQETFAEQFKEEAGL